MRNGKRLTKVYFYNHDVKTEAYVEGTSLIIVVNLGYYRKN